MARRRLIRAVGGLALLGVVVALALTGGDGEREPAGGVAGDRASPPAMASVLSVTDGDTIVVELDGEEERVRLIGIDTPETARPGQPQECFADEATEFSRELMAGESVRLRFDRELRDRFGRLLAYVYAGDRLVNAELVRRGFARTLTIEPNTALAERLSRLEGRAGASGRGLWSRCGA